MSLIWESPVRTFNSSHHHRWCMTKLAGHHQCEVCGVVRVFWRFPQNGES